MKNDTKELLEVQGQDHLVSYINDSNTSKSSRDSLIKQIESFNLTNVFTIFQNTKKKSKSVDATDKIEPIPYPTNLISIDDVPDIESISLLGLKSIGKSEIAVVTLAGGQGSRLGFAGPKGMYDFGLTMKQSLFQIQAKRIKYFMNQTKGTILWLVMTSPMNHNETEKYFVDNNYFNLGEKNVCIFQQGLLPCFDYDDKILLKSSSELCTSPDGNGGVYISLVQAGLTDLMKKRHIKYVHFVAIDNALVVPADPYIIGAAERQEGFELGNVTIRRTQWNEKVGTFAIRNQEFGCIEYSEIPSDLAQELDKSGNLKYRAGNTCNHLLSLDFLKSKVLSSSGLKSLYHIANKKIPYYDLKTKQQVVPTQNNGIKLELFIFDVFKLAKTENVLCVEKKREHSFAPVKNAPGNASDTPEIAVNMFRTLCFESFETNSLKINNSKNGYIEISPLIDISLKALKEVEFELPCVLITEDEIGEYGLKTNELKKLGDSDSVNIRTSVKNNVNIYVLLSR